ncbi:hypothetical protein B0T26DRAFT_718570 [Lasiosphaeria miniovina]|uniref:Secreted protein n=1 Tax=Lasiosphaeria miniovina TaxID=1954250 RepID=A0AA40DUM8_9PEZI|nr:uncharacterized protein B0T26DRAFT_718570 [Lasiosphaeria miniovina]KAK0713826.1 hypothetical protein B0T26DRAFT_718570 [Lasiosphaeria miniovina]
MQKRSDATGVLSLLSEWWSVLAVNGPISVLEFWVVRFDQRQTDPARDWRGKVSKKETRDEGGRGGTWRSGKNRCAFVTLLSGRSDCGWKGICLLE